MKFISISWSLISSKVLALEKDIPNMAKMTIFIIRNNLVLLVC